MIIEGNHLIAAEGKVLTNGESYSTEVWLGIYDNQENWHEVDEVEESFEIEEPNENEDEDEEDYKTALYILLGLRE